MNRLIPLYKIFFDQKDIRAITGVIKSGHNWANGPAINQFESKIAKFLNRRHAVTFNSGTSALIAILTAYGIKPEDEIIIPSFTFVATANAVCLLGAKPVFTDIENQTYGIDADLVSKKITSKTRAIIPVHYGGCPCLKIAKLAKICRQHNLLLIEDAAESFGAEISHKKVGTFGQASMFSFCQNKIITTGEGGVAVTDNHQIYRRLLAIRAPTEDTCTKESVYNWRMPTILAALGLSQLAKINSIIKRRREIANYYSLRLKSVWGIKPWSLPNKLLPTYQMYTIRVNQNLRNKLSQHLESLGIDTKVYFKPIHLCKLFSQKYGFKKDSLPITEAASREVLTLPLYPTLSKSDIDKIVFYIQKFMAQYYE